MIVHTNKANATRERIYQFICAYIQTCGFPPSQREIAEGCAVSKTTVQYQLQFLVAAGRVSYEPGKIRTLRLL